ncbi:hypothetical protein [Pseudomonas sp. 008]|uniref:hypothetical protein n=1 Tax=Pseudomonas sp. 008 TaxID=2803906 RepID=UPI00194DDE97|nr:hypothetical protein [Pseudomonas sp. 008]GID02997.1 hypothetical protein TMM008_01990 [Pseudomonas sp. 008]
MSNKTKISSNADTAQAPARYRRAVVTFLDILGFANLVKSGEANKVAQVLSAVRKYAIPEGHDELIGDEPTVCSVAFSDSIVRVRFLDGDNLLYPTGHVLSEINHLSLIQGELISENIILRGAVTIGEIYLNQGMIFGPAMVTAYELESKLAIYPRIVIDPSVLNEVRKDATLRREGYSGDDEIKDIRKLVDRGDNGLWYINYLTSICMQLDTPEKLPNLIHAHKHLIISRYSDGGHTKGYLDKILWLAVYHNKFISKLLPLELDGLRLRASDFEVKTTEIPELARLPRAAH